MHIAMAGSMSSNCNSRSFAMPAHAFPELLLPRAFRGRILSCTHYLFI